MITKNCVSWLQRENKLAKYRKFGYNGVFYKIFLVNNEISFNQQDAKKWTSWSQLEEFFKRRARTIESMKGLQTAAAPKKKNLFSKLHKLE